MTGDELKQARKARGLSRRALAALTGLHPDSIRYWERKARIDLRGYAPVRIVKALRTFALETLGNIATIPRARSGLLPSSEFCHAIKKRETRLLAELAERRAQGPWKRCGARSRKGKPCRAKALPGKTRCKFHGGASTGPRTAEGKARIAEAQRKRWAIWRSDRADRKHLKDG
jgi:transcriptional regulator with XRE-family HTH domain